MDEKRFVCVVAFSAASHFWKIVMILFYFCQIRVSDVSQGDWGQSQGQDQRRHRQARLGARFSGLKVAIEQDEVF